MYDIIIIGGGPAGLTAAIYAKEANMSVLVLEKMGVGGQLNNIFNITNYPGFESIDGFELSQKMKNQAKNLGAEFKFEEVIGVNLSGEIKIINTHKAQYECKNLIISTGAYARPLEVENEREFYGKGLSYCATCDGALYKGKVVAVVGGGNSSIDDCLYLSNLAQKIYLIHRREQFTATKSAFNKVKNLSLEQSKIIFKTNTVVSKLIGDDKLRKIEILNRQTGKSEVLDIDGIFVAIGRKPDTDIFLKQIELDGGGFIRTNEYMETNIKNVYAVGDVRNTPFRQIVTACADGAVAIRSIVTRNKNM